VESSDNLAGLWSYQKPFEDLKKLSTSLPTHYKAEYIPDNWYYNQTSSQMWVTDVNKDGVVNIVDITKVAKIFNKQRAEENWDPRFDVAAESAVSYSPNGIINIYDQSYCGKFFSQPAWLNWKCDFNHDGVINTDDLELLKPHFNTHGPIPGLDLDFNGVINIMDITLAAKDFGKRY
jgi:hypothetical protein